MNTQKLSCSIVTGVILSLAAAGEYTYRNTQHEAIPTITAAGVVSDRFDSSYSCGSKGRNTCYARYLTINGQDYQVTDDVYKTTQVGHNVTLTRNIEPELTTWQWWSDIIHMINVVALFLAGLFFFVAFITWACCYSNRKTFKEFLAGI